MPSEHLGTQYRLLLMDVGIKRLKLKKKTVGKPRVRRWNLTRENTAKLSNWIKTGGSWKHVEAANIMWATMVECI